MASKSTLSVTLLAASLAIPFFLTCSDNGDGDIEVSTAIIGISRIDANYAYAEVRYSATGTSINEVGVIYSTTTGRLNVGAFDSYNGVNTEEFGIVSGLPSVTGTFGADLSGLRHSTTYYVVPYLKLNKATGDFYKGYFVPTGGHKDFLTLADENSGTSPSAVSAVTVAGVSYTTATLSASVTSAGQPGFTDRGFCYGTVQNPTRDGTCVRVSGTQIAFSSSISGLSENTTYYVRAYIVNESFGTRYGAETNFKTRKEAVATTFTFTDERDGTVYQAVDIEGMVWMAENLRYVGDFCTGNNLCDNGNSSCYDYDDLNCEIYGRLYNLTAAKVACPAGWHLPEHFEWSNLIDVVGPSAGIKLKSEIGWNGTDDLGFAALPGGRRNFSSYQTLFTEVGMKGYWWEARVNSTNLYIREMSSNSGGVDRRDHQSSFASQYHFSVRCVRDE